MRNIILILLIFLFVNVWSQVPPKPETNSFVYDYAETYTDSQRVALQNLLYEFEIATQVQIILLNADYLNGLTIEDYSIQIAENWGIGDEEDKGILICNYIPERKTRIEVGYGLEAVITDFWASKHIREDASPYFKNGYHFRGVYELIISLMNQIEPNYQPSLINNNIVNQVKEVFQNKIPEKPDPFVYFINDTKRLSGDTLIQFENKLKKIYKDYNLPIHFLLINNKTITKDNILDYGYKVRDLWLFPKIIELEDYEDGVLIVYNIANNSASNILGYGFKEDLLYTTTELFDSTLLNSSLTLANRLDSFFNAYSSHYGDIASAPYDIILWIIGVLLFIAVLAYFLRNTKISSKSQSGFPKDKWKKDLEDKANNSSNNNETNFGGGSFGGGGATGNW